MGIISLKFLYFKVKVKFLQCSKCSNVVSFLPLPLWDTFQCKITNFFSKICNISIFLMLSLDSKPKCRRICFTKQKLSQMVCLSCLRKSGWILWAETYRVMGMDQDSSQQLMLVEETHTYYLDPKAPLTASTSVFLDLHN